MNTRAVLTTFASVLLVSALPPAVARAGAQTQTQDEAPIPKDYRFGNVTLGGLAKDSDRNSAKFEEYRDLKGVTALGFRVDGAKDGLRYQLHTSNLAQDTRALTGFLEKGKWRLDVSHQGIPHRFGNDARSLNVRTGPGEFRIDDAVQRSIQTRLEAVPRSSINYAFLSPIVSPLVNAATPFDLDFTRKRSRALFTLNPTSSLQIEAGYFNELRDGFRGGAGTSFGFGNVVETPDDTDYTTQDIGLNAVWSGEWGSARAGFHYNWFRNAIPSLTFDNPFRATDATDASAYQAPGSASINGAVTGRVALPPDNDAVIGSAGVTLKFGDKTRAHLDASYGQWTQDRTPFVAQTTNTAITTPVAAFNVASLPAQKLDGRIDVTSLAANVNSRPADGWNISARFRMYELDNKTSRFTIPGYVRFDGGYQATPRISVPYGHATDRAEATVTRTFEKVTLEAGFRWNAVERHFRETEKTTENGFTGAVDFRLGDSTVWRSSVELGSRDFEHLEIELSEDASFVTPGAPTNIFASPSSSVCGSSVICNLRFDQAPRDFTRFSSLLMYTPGDKWALTGAYIYAKSDYKDSLFGLRDGTYDSFTVEADFTPTDRWNLYGYYSFENQKDTLLGRQSGATPSVNPIDNWTSLVDDKVDSIGGGLNVVLKPDKWDLNLNGSWQKVDGNNDFSGPPGGTVANARASTGGITDLAAYDDLEITTINGELKYRFDKRWAFAAGGTWEKYDIADANTDDLVYYVPGSFFLNGNNGDYKGKWGYIRVIYTW